jgi:hypothetical protein
MAAPVMHAMATGIMDFGENSNNKSSIASIIAATGLPKIAAIPAVAPAVNKIFLSYAVIFNICPISEPNAPPAAIIGPSAPKGPPVPIATSPIFTPGRKSICPAPAGSGSIRPPAC